VRNLAVTQNITVDGSIELLGNWFDPQRQGEADNSDLFDELQQQDRQADALLLGRRTFEDFRSYWPSQTGAVGSIADYLNQVQKYVVSATVTDPGWQNSTVLAGDPVTEVQALKDRPGKDIVLTGSISLCHALIGAGLVDEFRLFVYPAVQGHGRRLFPDDGGSTDLRLVEAKVFRSGVTYSRYALVSR
jgi:dihydrofolate reductase